MCDMLPCPVATNLRKRVRETYKLKNGSKSYVDIIQFFKQVRFVMCCCLRPLSPKKTTLVKR